MPGKNERSFWDYRIDVLNQSSGELPDVADGRRYDRHGNRIMPDMYNHFHRCRECGHYEWHASLPLGMCSYCVVMLLDFEFEMSFGKSKSKFYRTAVRRARQIPDYIKEAERYIVRAHSLNEFACHRVQIVKPMYVISRWKSFEALLNNENITGYHISVIQDRINRMRDQAGAAEIAFSGNVPIFIPKEELIPGTIISIDPNYPSRAIETSYKEVLNIEDKSKEEPLCLMTQSCP
jgi:hypothetical protein